MLIDTLTEHARAYNNLKKEILDKNAKQYFVGHADISTATPLLISLINRRTMQLSAFELLLKINKEEALNLLKSSYLSPDLSNHFRDHVSGLDIMLCDVKDILGEDELNKLLICKKFLHKNRRNRRVKEAIRFAKEDD